MNTIPVQGTTSAGFIPRRIDTFVVVLFNGTVSTVSFTATRGGRPGRCQADISFGGREWPFYFFGSCLRLQSFTYYSYHVEHRPSKNTLDLHGNAPYWPRPGGVLWWPATSAPVPSRQLKLCQSPAIPVRANSVAETVGAREIVVSPHNLPLPFRLLPNWPSTLQGSDLPAATSLYNEQARGRLSRGLRMPLQC